MRSLKVCSSQEVERNGWNKDFAQRNPFLSSHFAWIHSTHTTPTQILDLYRCFNRIQNIILNVSTASLRSMPFSTNWYEHQWARNTCKILDSKPLFRSHKSNQIRLALAFISFIVWNVIFHGFIAHKRIHSNVHTKRIYFDRLKFSMLCSCFARLKTCFIFFTFKNSIRTFILMPFHPVNWFIDIRCVAFAVAILNSLLITLDTVNLHRHAASYHIRFPKKNEAQWPIDWV